MTGKGLSFSDMDESVKVWNDITNIEYGSLASVVSTDLTIYSTVISDLRTGAITDRFKDGGYVLITDLLNDDATCVHAAVRFNSQVTTGTSKYYKWMLSHEAGHALGLPHPHNTCQCKDKAIMNYHDEPTSTDHPGSYVVTYHDEYNLDRIFG